MRAAYYFNAGEFHLPVAGFTHYDNTNGVVRFSAYRFHEMDSLVFSDGLRVRAVLFVQLGVAAPLTRTRVRAVCVAQRRRERPQDGPQVHHRPGRRAERLAHAVPGGRLHVGLRVQRQLALLQLTRRAR